MNYCFDLYPLQVYIHLDYIGIKTKTRCSSNSPFYMFMHKQNTLLYPNVLKGGSCLLV